MAVTGFFDLRKLEIVTEVVVGYQGTPFGIDAVKECFCSFDTLSWIAAPEFKPIPTT
jgi:hypothetical protein